MRYEAWIDRGGTFTDCVLIDRLTGERRLTKVLSSDDAPLVGLRQLLDLSPDAPVPPCDVFMGTTLATNALLERKGARTALVITRGFADILAIGDQTRPELFALSIPPRQQLQRWTFEVNARLDAAGDVLESPSDEDLASLVARLVAVGATSVALVCMHASVRPEFERGLRARLLDHFPSGQAPRIYCSSESLAEQGLLSRAGACVVDAYVSPLLDAYLGHLQSALPGSRLQLMQSSGGLCPPTQFRGPQALLSGPAGGVVAAERIAAETGSVRLVSLDMGGTSTDVALVLGYCDLRRETSIGGIPLRSPTLDIHTVASGGGSVCDFDGYRLVVGPESTGAVPGPLCYGLAGRRPDDMRVAITDVNLILGRLASDFFPFPLDVEAARRGLTLVADKIGLHTGQRPALDHLASDFSRLVTVQMAEAIRSVVLSRGLDVQSVDLLIFGGAAGQHACDVARYLGIRQIHAHRLSGVLSAYGIGHADTLWQKEQDGRRRELTAEVHSTLDDEFEALEVQGRRSYTSPSQSEPTAERWVELRYRGTDAAISVRFGERGETLSRFHAEHQVRFGYARPDDPVEVALLRSQLRWRRRETRSRGAAHGADPAYPRRSQVVALSDGEQRAVPVYYATDLPDDSALEGPALVLDPTGTLLVDEGFRLEMRGDLISLVDHVPRPFSMGDRAARTALLGHRFTAIATQMGEALRRSASSTNIRDRMDFSCAVFDRDASLIANAPHIPVHLGAMSATVRALKELHPVMHPGDSYVSNDPALGGSHLPDITVVTPVFDRDRVLLGFTASRGHHADIGGISPGSMPAHSTALEEEGIVLSGLLLVSQGSLLEDSVTEALSSGPHPARNPAENLADLKAQLAANQVGARLLLDLATELSRAALHDGMQDLCALAERWLADSLTQLVTGKHHFKDEMDDGTTIAVTIFVDPTGLVIDFEGSSPAQPSNINAPYAVTLASILYVLRALVAQPIPLNDGCLRRVEVKLPEASVVNPGPDCAVAAGNVETSQRIVDVLLGALGLCAASQGTMNNLSLGNASFGYYETIAGGSGAGPGWHGASAVHSHMTNTKITDPEMMEARFPLRVRSFSVRRASGGDGLYRGGDGVVREIEALAPLRYSLITDRRVTEPFGQAGGSPGARGRNFVDGRPVPGRTEGDIAPGSIIRIETPGGGGYGVAPPVSASPAKSSALT